MLDDMMGIIKIERINFMLIFFNCSDANGDISRTITFYLVLKAGSPPFVYKEDYPAMTAFVTLLVKKC